MTELQACTETLAEEDNYRWKVISRHLLSIPLENRKGIIHHRSLLGLHHCAPTLVHPSGRDNLAERVFNHSDTALQVLQVIAEREDFGQQQSPQTPAFHFHLVGERNRCEIDFVFLLSSPEIDHCFPILFDARLIEFPHVRRILVAKLHGKSTTPTGSNIHRGI